MFFLNHYGMIAGGGLGALITGLVAAQSWAAGWPGPLSGGAAPATAPARELDSEGCPHASPSLMHVAMLPRKRLFSPDRAA